MNQISYKSEFQEAFDFFLEISNLFKKDFNPLEQTVYPYRFIDLMKKHKAEQWDKFCHQIERFYRILTENFLGEELKKMEGSFKEVQSLIASVTPDKVKDKDIYNLFINFITDFYSLIIEDSNLRLLNDLKTIDNRDILNLKQITDLKFKFPALLEDTDVMFETEPLEISHSDLKNQ